MTILAVTDAMALEATPASLTDALVDYLLISRPLIDIARGEKRLHMRRAYSRLAAWTVSRQIEDATAVPVGRRGVALALHRQCLELCRAHGLGAADLIAAYNEFVDGMPAQGDAASRLKALVAFLIAESFVGDDHV